LALAFLPIKVAISSTVAGRIWECAAFAKNSSPWQTKKIRMAVPT